MMSEEFFRMMKEYYQATINAMLKKQASQKQNAEKDFYFEVYLPVKYFKIGGKTKDDALQNMVGALAEYCDVSKDTVQEDFLIREVPKDMLPNNIIVTECIKKDE